MRSLEDKLSEMEQKMSELQLGQDVDNTEELTVIIVFFLTSFKIVHSV